MTRAGLSTLRDNRIRLTLEGFQQRASQMRVLVSHRRFFARFTPKQDAPHGSRLIN